MKVLVTGGAGFIGSNLVNELLQDERFQLVRVMDNLITGHRKNIEEFLGNPKFEFFESDIQDLDACLKATDGMDLISHQAALGSVPRSIDDPILTNSINISGTLNIFHAAVKQGVRRVVFAASSSTYGDELSHVKVEDKIGKPLSPYAITKYVNELYADIFSRSYDFEYVGLRYFNVFGPKQDPLGPYAAVIPIFIDYALTDKAPTINGDGKITRDFTYVKNAVQANIKAMLTENVEAKNQVYNVALGQTTSLTDLWESIKALTNSKADVIYGPPRAGDIIHSLADVSKAQRLLDYKPLKDIEKGLIETIQWYKSNKALEVHG